MSQIDGPLLTRYLRGACSEEERRRVEAWMQGAPERRRHVRDLERLWRAGAAPRVDIPAPDQYIDADWERLREKMHTPASGTTARVKDPRGGGLTDRSDDPALQRARSRRVSRSRFVPSSTRSVIRGAAVMVVVVAVAFFLVERMDATETAPLGRSDASALRTVATGAGEWARLTLSDGTHVRLNVGSKLRYPKTFSGAKREVYLSGEAYFEVEADAARPFVIHAGGTVVRVHGTTFDVRAYAKDRVRVAVSGGKVTLQVADPAGTGQDAVTLTEDMVGRYQDGEIAMVAAGANLERQLAWLKGQLAFEDTPMRAVAAELERWYGVDIRLKGAELAGRRLTATFEDEPLGVVLSVVAAAVEASYEREGGRVTLRLREKNPSAR